MSTSEKTKKKGLAEQEIDRIVVVQADDDAAWEKPIRAQRAESAPLTLPSDLVARATFLAQLHRTKNVDEWLARVIRERIELEEAVFLGVKHELVAKPT